MADFVFEVITTGVDEIFTLPLQSNGSYDFNVDWGDTNDDDITAWDDAAKTHTYAVADTYTVTIDPGVAGEIDGWSFNNNADAPKIGDISAWGDLRLGDNNAYFYGCINLTISAVDTLDLTGTNYMINAFRNCSSLTTNAAMNSWDLSGILHMAYMFSGCSVFNPADIGNWDVSSVANMGYTFQDCSIFNPDIGSWDVSSVAIMFGTFENCEAFDQDLGSWNIITVATMQNMFFGCILSTTNYNALLVGWSALAAKNDVVFNAGLSRYSRGAAEKRFILADTYGWTITDGGIDATTALNSIREQIILAIISNLADITIANGYGTDIGKNVERAKFGLTEGELPSVVVWPQAEEANKIHGKTRITMPVKMEGLSLFTDIQNPSVICELMLGDIRKRMEAQGSTNNVADGLAESIEYSAGGTDEYPEPGHDRVGVYAVFNIMYKTVAGDPYS